MLLVFFFAIDCTAFVMLFKKHFKIKISIIKTIKQNSVKINTKLENWS